MAYSKINICNTALALLGEDSIRSFDQPNKRAKMCDTFFDTTRDYLLFSFDWSFARKIAKLQPLAGIETPDHTYPYGLPSDCRVVRDLYPRGSKDWWEIVGGMFLCRTPSDVYIYYTKQATNPAAFSDAFANILALAMAVKMSPAISQDKSLTQVLYNQYKIELREAWEADANQGNNYRAYDESPENDKFVNPDSWVAGVDPNERI